MVLRRANLVLQDLFIPNERSGQTPALLINENCDGQPPSAPKAGVRGVLKMAAKWRPQQTNIKKVQLASPNVRKSLQPAKVATPKYVRRDARIDELFCDLGISFKRSEESVSAVRMATLCRAGPSLRAIAAASNQRRTAGTSALARYATQQVGQTEAAPPTHALSDGNDEVGSLTTCPSVRRVARRPCSAAPR